MGCFFDTGHRVAARGRFNQPWSDPGAKSISAIGVTEVTSGVVPLIAVFILVHVIHFALAVIVAMDARELGIVTRSEVTIGAIEVPVIAAGDREVMIKIGTVPLIGVMTRLALSRITRCRMIRVIGAVVIA